MQERFNLMYLSQNLIEKVRELSDIVSIISEYTNLTKKGQGYVGKCPFHTDKTPSFYVSEDKQMYHCFGCGVGGNTITFMMEKENLTFVEAVESLATRANIPLEYEDSVGNRNEENVKREVMFRLYNQAARFYYYALNNNAKDYLQKRGVSERVIKNFGIGYSPPDYNILYKYFKQLGYEDEILIQSGLCLKSERTGNIYDRFSDRLMFPIFNTNKKVIAFGGRVFGDQNPKYLNSPESLIFDKSQTLYALNFAKMSRSDYYILVEGYMDVVAMHKAGFTQTVASLGTAFTKAQARLLKRYTEQVVILYDSDKAGEKATLRAIPILRQEGINVRVLQLKDSKDPDEYLTRYGKESLEKLIDSAKSDTWFEVLRLEKQYNLSIAEQKISFLQKSSQIIAKLSSGIEQLVYIDEMAKKYDIATDAIKAEVNKQERARNYTNETSNQLVSTIKKANVQIELLSILYHHKNIFPNVEPYIGEELFDAGIIRDLFRYVQTRTEKELAYLNASYTTIEEQKIISNVIMGDDIRYEDSKVLYKTLNDSVKALNNVYIKRQLKTSTDPLELQELLSKKKVLDKLNIALING